MSIATAIQPGTNTIATLDIPLPPSVNRTRKVDWRGNEKYRAWKKQASWHVVATGQYAKLPRQIERYELTITLDREQCTQDPDNPVKAAVDLLRMLLVITDDSPNFCERIVIEWGEAPDGCRLTVRSLP